jgi:hypothetical protein
MRRRRAHTADRTYGSRRRRTHDRRRRHGAHDSGLQRTEEANAVLCARRPVRSLPICTTARCRRRHAFHRDRVGGIGGAVATGLDLALLRSSLSAATHWDSTQSHAQIACAAARAPTA